jgi:hypothetical protein
MNLKLFGGLLSTDLSTSDSKFCLLRTFPDMVEQAWMAGFTGCLDKIARERTRHLSIIAALDKGEESVRAKMQWLAFS